MTKTPRAPRTPAHRVEERIWIEHEKYAIQVWKDGRPQRRAIGTLEEARAALRRFDETGYLPPRQERRGPAARPHMRAAPPAPPAAAVAAATSQPPEVPEAGERSQMDHLSTARNALQSAKVLLEAELRQVNNALEALTDEEDASAAFRTPGSSADNLTDEQRARLTGGVAPAPAAAAPAAPRGRAKNARRHDRETYAKIRDAVAGALSLTEPMNNEALRGAVNKKLGLEVSREVVGGALGKLKNAGKARSQLPPSGQRNATVWFAVEPKSKPSEPTPAMSEAPAPAG